MRKSIFPRVLLGLSLASFIVMLLSGGGVAYITLEMFFVSSFVLGAVLFLIENFSNKSADEDKKFSLKRIIDAFILIYIIIGIIGLILAIL